jgi:hypothetical protein
VTGISGNTIIGDYQDHLTADLHGFIATATPEPTGILSLCMIGLFLARHRHVSVSRLFNANSPGLRDNRSGAFSFHRRCIVVA